MQRKNDFKKIKRDYTEKATAWNCNLLLFVCLFCILVELFNIIRVVGFSNSGLGTLNNRIYFGFYTALLFLCVLYVTLELALRRTQRISVRYGICMSGMAMILLWQTLFQIYDISRSSANGYITIVAALVAFSSIAIMRPVYAVVNLIFNYGLFFLALRDSGDRFNFTIMLLLCMVIYLVKYRSFLSGLFQEQELQFVHHELNDKTDKLRLSNEQYEILAQSSNLIAFQWHMKEGWLHFASNRETEFDWPDRIEDFLLKVRESKIIREESKHIIYRCEQQAIQGISHQKYEILLPSKNRTEKWYELQMTMQMDREGNPLLGIGFLSNIMKQKEKTENLEEQLQMDSFTRLLNKAAIEERGMQMIERLKAEEELYMLITDIDNFKAINDRFGHICGDHVLKTIADTMNRLAPENMEIGRIGGDEFMALFSGGQGKEIIKNYARQLLEGTSEVLWAKEELPVSLSIGIASAAPGEMTYAQLYTAADKAMYIAKNDGKGKIVFA